MRCAGLTAAGNPGRRWLHVCSNDRDGGEVLRERGPVPKLSASRCFGRRTIVDIEYRSLELVMTRDRAYFVLMGGCIIAVILAWTVVRLFSVTAAVIISVCAGLIPPVAAIVANAGDEGFRRR